jgi:hypothetical protein
MGKQRKGRKTDRSLSTPVWVGGLAGLILVAVGLIFLTSQQGSNSNSNSLPYPDIARVSPAEAHSQQQADTGIIIDVRDAPFFEESRAAGAISIPEDELSAHIEELPTDKTLIFY